MHFELYDSVLYILFPSGLKRLERKADHLPPANAMIKNC
jgi:hypothetical protein